MTSVAAYLGLAAKARRKGERKVLGRNVLIRLQAAEWLDRQTA